MPKNWSTSSCSAEYTSVYVAAKGELLDLWGSGGLHAHRSWHPPNEKNGQRVMWLKPNILGKIYVIPASLLLLVITSQKSVTYWGLLNFIVCKKNNTNIWFFTFPDFWEAVKFAASIERPKAKCFSSVKPWPGALSLDPLGALPQTPVTGINLYSTLAKGPCPQNMHPPTWIWGPK